MTTHALPALYAIFIWWASTGLIVYLDGLPRRTFRISLGAATLVLALALWGGAASAEQQTLAGAFCGFSVGLLAWGWIELAFLTGFVTGPWRKPCPENVSGLARAGYAFLAILWHEIAIALMAVLLAFVTLERGNETAFWTFVILWAMRTSAKLNVFLGVRNLAEEFLPQHLRYLASFFTARPMNLLFPVVVTLATVVTVLILTAAADAATDFRAAQLTLLGTLLGLAVLEHWMLVLPFPSTALWKWSLSDRLKRGAAVHPAATAEPTTPHVTGAPA
jgi:putative photosynthetic complex assembly protein 2